VAKDFFERAAAGAFIGIPGCITIAAVNLLFHKGTQIEKKRKSVVRIVIWTMSMSIIASVIGTAAFFSHAS